jgi:hypothetical protein
MALCRATCVPPTKLGDAQLEPELAGLAAVPVGATHQTPPTARAAGGFTVFT